MKRKHFIPALMTMFIFMLMGCTSTKVDKMSDKTVDKKLTIGGSRLTVFFEKPADWETLQVYYYNSNPASSLDWGAAPEMIEDSANPGWYYYEFPEGFTAATVMFKDSSGKQIPASGEAGKDISQNTWFYSSFKNNTTINPFGESKPQIFVTTEDEFSNTLIVDLKIISDSDIISMSYILDGVETKFDNPNTSIEFGEDLAVGDIATLIVKAENEIGETVSSEYEYEKTSKEVWEKLEKIEAYNDLRMYQIMVSAYIDGKPGGYGKGYGPSHHNGDLQGVINALDYIEDLGINAIWLTPIFESKEDPDHNQWEVRGRTTGYFADDYFNIDPKFGTNEEFKTLVDEAHARGIYVFLDGVFGHHGSFPIEGVTDKKGQWYGYETKYPESLEFFKDVATYWIEEYEIDGWRMDQAYQLYQDNKNYWKQIRETVEEVTAKRKAEGKEWGTLGYMVGEIWDGSGNDIKNRGYAKNGLRSCFDFPTRYALVQALAVDEGKSSAPLSKLNESLNIKYPEFAQQNMFISNHDVVRLGDLIQRAGLKGYWERHKVALSFLAAYTGPITLYYGDEYGDEHPNFVERTDLDSEPYIAEDNVARSNGQIDDFTAEEQDLINYTKKLMEIRKNYSSLSHGERTNLVAGDTQYADLKEDENNKVLYVINSADFSSAVKIKDLPGTTLVDLMTGEEIKIKAETSIPMKKISARFLLVK